MCSFKLIWLREGRNEVLALLSSKKEFFFTKLSFLCHVAIYTIESYISKCIIACIPALEWNLGVPACVNAIQVWRRYYFFSQGSGHCHVSFLFSPFALINFPGPCALLFSARSSSLIQHLSQDHIYTFENDWLQGKGYKSLQIRFFTSCIHESLLLVLIFSFPSQALTSSRHTFTNMEQWIVETCS